MIEFDEIQGAKVIPDEYGIFKFDECVTDFVTKYEAIGAPYTSEWLLVEAALGHQVRQSSTMCCRLVEFSPESSLLKFG